MTHPEESLKKEIVAIEKEVISLRRNFHQYPEIGLQEIRTAKIVAEYMENIGLPVTTKVGRTGVVGLLQGKNPGKTLMIRADMDALPILEENQVPYRSKTDGIMHACGHDAHTAILLATAKILNNHRDTISGNVKFVFQPSEDLIELASSKSEEPSPASASEEDPEPALPNDPQLGENEIDQLRARISLLLREEIDTREWNIHQRIVKELTERITSEEAETTKLEQELAQLSAEKRTMKKEFEAYKRKYRVD